MLVLLEKSSETDFLSPLPIGQKPTQIYSIIAQSIRLTRFYAPSFFHQSVHAGHIRKI